MMEPTTTGAKVLRVILALAALTAIIGAIIGAALLVKGIYDRGVVTKATNAGNVRIERDMGIANTAAAVEKGQDDVALERLDQELTDAIKPKPNDDAAAVRIRNGCVVLRQQGRDTSRIAACRAAGR